MNYAVNSSINIWFYYYIGCTQANQDRSDTSVKLTNKRGIAVVRHQSGSQTQTESSLLMIDINFSFKI